MPTLKEESPKEGAGTHASEKPGDRRHTGQVHRGESETPRVLQRAEQRRAGPQANAPEDAAERIHQRPQRGDHDEVLVLQSGAQNW